MKFPGSMLGCPLGADVCMEDHSLPHCFLRGSFALIFEVFCSFAAHAGAIPTGELHMPQGNTAPTSDGDYVTASTALNTTYHYWIEVPPGLGHLVVEVFDADVGAGADETGVRDRARTTYSTAATYTLIRPDTTVAATLNCSSAVSPTCPDNAWIALLDSMTAQNTAAGHWELRITMGAGDDLDAIGIRANDGTPGGGGTELNLYADAILSIGVHPSATGTNTHSYTLYPYLTSGCSASENDFDFDSENGGAVGVGSLKFTSRGGAFTQTVASASLGANNTWARNPITGWTSDQLSADYGIWKLEAAIKSYTNSGAPNGNYADIYLGKHPRWIKAAAQADPTAPGTWRLGFVPQAGARYLAAAPAALKAPAALRAWSVPSLLSSGNRAGYLVLAPASLRGAALRLATLRQSRGLITMVVTTEQVFDELAAGVPTPHALQDFLTYAGSHWSLPPHYVVLAGAGSLDYRNLLGFGDCLVPPLLVQSSGGRFTVPGVPSLGEVLVTTGTGGAAAVWGPSGLANNADSLLLAERFYHTVTDPADLPLGDRILRACGDLRNLGGDRSLLHIYNLLGDPALRLRHGPVVPSTGGPGQQE